MSPTLTIIARVRDGLPLAEGLDSGSDSLTSSSGSTKNEMFTFKSQAKAICKKIASNYPSQKPAPRMTIETGSKHVFHYVCDAHNVLYMTLTEKQYPRKLAYQYLDELSKEFSMLYGSQVDTVTRPYAFIKFDTFIQKTKKVYADTRTQRNMERLNADLHEVQSIMTKNIQEVLGQGERLDRMTEMSNMLSQDAKDLAVKAKGLYHQALVKKYLPWVVVVCIILLVMIIRFWFY
jgi:vesicle transport protein SEC22